MKLINATLRPGEVRSVEENGVIKASAPGLFSAVDPPENLPPIYPFFIGSNSRAFSLPEAGDEVWVMQFTDNPLQLYWFRKDSMSDLSHLNLSGEQDVEVLCDRESGTGWATIYFSNGSGWVLQNNDSVINIKKDGSILLSTGMPHQSIEINGKGISLGSEGGSQYSAVRGEPLIDVLNEILSALGRVGKAASANPYTASIGAVLTPLPAKTAQSVSAILSSNVTLD